MFPIPRMWMFLVLALVFHSVSTIEFTRRQTVMIGSDMSLSQPEICWGANDTHIEIQLAYPTLGWMAMGLSPNGGMDQADVLFAYVDDKTGEVVVQDRYIMVSPTFAVNVSLDRNQDWKTVSGSQNATHTTVRAVRKLNTCDPTDRPFIDAAIPVIYSYNYKDPDSKTGPIRKHNQRAGTQINFLKISNSVPPTERIVQNLTFTMGDVPIPATQNTYYICRMMKLPTFDKKYHAVSVAPIVDPRNVDLLHHMLLYTCIGEIPGVTTETFQCDLNSAIPTMDFCRGLIGGWASGAQGRSYPLEAALPFSPAMSGQYVMLQAHFNNPNMRSGIDNSGFTYSLTDQLRKFDIGALMTGILNLDYILTIPPGEETFKISAQCSDQCTMDSIPKDGVTVISGALHMHTRGRSGVVRHFRGSVELPILVKNMNYDYNLQNQIEVSPRKIMPGDRLVVECTFSTEADSRDTFIFGGEGTMQEMCLGFISYYPKSNLSICGAQYNLPGFLSAIDMPGNLIAQSGLKQLPGQTILQALHVRDQNKLAKQMEDGITSYIKNSFWEGKQVDKLEQFYRSKQYTAICISQNGEITAVLNDNPPFIEPIQDFSGFAAC